MLLSPSSNNRSMWKDATPITLSPGSDLFEVSGKFLSSRHSALEEVLSDHHDVCHALQLRLEVSPHLVQPFA